MRATATIRDVLRPGPYRTYTAGNAVSLIGTWMQRVTVGYLTWELTGSAAWLGVMSIADLFPTVIIGPLAGVMADRWNRYGILRATQALGLIQAAAMAALYEAGLLSIGVMLAFTIALGVVSAVAQPARLAIISTLVPRHALGTAVAINSINFNLARFTGPAVAGILISTVGTGWAFAANALSYAVFLWAMTRMPDSIRQPGTVRQNGRFLAELAAGFSYVRHHRGTLIVMLMLTVTGICSRPVIELLPGFAAAVFGAGPVGLAVLTSAIGVGAMAGGLWMASRRGATPHSSLIVHTALAGAVMVIGFSQATTLVAGVPLLVGAGFCWVCTGVGAQTLLQTGVEDRVRGRVLSLYGLIVKASPAVGALAVGVLSDRFGLQPTLLASGIVAGAYILAQYLLIPAIRADLERPDS